MHEFERWRVSPRYPAYEVSSLGSVRNRATDRVLRPQDNGRHALFVRLTVGGVQRTVTLRNLVAETWDVSRKSYGTVLTHLDGDYRNCAVSNLLYTNQRFIQRKRYERLRAEPLDDTMVENITYGYLYDNARDAADSVNELEEDIIMACDYNQPGIMVGGCEWRYFYGNPDLYPRGPKRDDC